MRTSGRVLIGITFILAAASLQRAWAQTPRTARAIDDAALRSANKSGDDWLTYGHDPGETRFSPLNQINATNVSRLGLTWTYDVGNGGGNQEDTPLVRNGILYGITNWSIVFAVDARTGKEKWRWDPEVNQAAVAPKLCCGVVTRGMAMYGNLIIAPILDGRLQALDMDTGKIVWEARVAYSQENYTITMAPRIAKGKVIIGVAGGEYPVRGFFSAFDAATGKFAWKFYTVPGDPSKPFENPALKKAAATWDKDGWKLGGGGPVWDGIAYDPEADLLYVGTGNAGPWPEDLRHGKDEKNGKDNLYACSVLAVKPDTGELKWYFQMVPGDSWDYDSVQQLLLADITVKGKPRKVIMQANKNGFYYVLDRVTGQFISGQPFAQLNWARGLNEETGRPIINEAAHYGSAGSVQLAPGPGGAHNWSPMSFNPATGLVYIPTTAFSAYDFLLDDNFVYTDGKSNLGIVLAGRPTADAGDAKNAGAAKKPVPKLPAPPFIGPPAPPPGERGILMAWDPVTQKEKWRGAGGGSTGGGTVTTAGNLVFQVIPDGRLVAYRADTGEKLLDVKTNLRGAMGPPVTYMVDGKQYVTFLGGAGKLRAQEMLATSGPQPKMMTFVLDGKMAMPVPAPAK